MTIPTVTIFVRHSAACPRQGEEFYKSCKCPKHLRWSHQGKQHRRSAKTRAWAIAEQRRREREAQFQASGDPSKPIAPDVPNNTISRTIELFISNKRTQGLAGNALKKYERELGRFEEFMAKRGRYFPHEIRLEDLTEFRVEWEEMYPSSITRAKAQQRLKGFLRYCFESRLIDRVPRLSPIRMDEPPTLPLSDSQYDKLLKIIPSSFTVKKGKRVHALIRLMRFSGLAIRDAVTLERDELQHDKNQNLYRITTSRQKTGVHVSVPIPPDLAVELIEVMKLNKNPRYIFWNTGNGTVQSAVGKWHASLKEAFVAAGQPDGHPHQLRDTFAVSLLQMAFITSKEIPIC